MLFGLFISTLFLNIKSLHVNDSSSNFQMLHSMDFSRMLMKFKPNRRNQSTTSQIRMFFLVQSGKSPEKDGPLGGALLSEVSTLFEMLMTQKADAHPGPRADVLYRLSAAYRRSLGLEAAANATNAANTAQNPATPERRSQVSPSTGLYHQ